MTLNCIKLFYLTATGEAAALVAHRAARHAASLAHRAARHAASLAHRAARTALLTLLTTRLLLLATSH